MSATLGGHPAADGDRALAHRLPDSEDAPAGQLQLGRVACGCQFEPGSRRLHERNRLVKNDGFPAAPDDQFTGLPVRGGTRLASVRSV